MFGVTVVVDVCWCWCCCCCCCCSRKILRCLGMRDIVAFTYQGAIIRTTILTSVNKWLGVNCRGTWGKTSKGGPSQTGKLVNLRSALKWVICINRYLSLQCNQLLDAWQAILVNKFLQSLKVVNLVFLITMVSDIFFTLNLFSITQSSDRFSATNKTLKTRRVSAKESAISLTNDRHCFYYL